MYWKILIFLFNIDVLQQLYTEAHGLWLLGRIPGYSRTDIKLLPSSVSKTGSGECTLQCQRHLRGLWCTEHSVRYGNSFYPPKWLWSKCPICDGPARKIVLLSNMQLHQTSRSQQHCQSISHTFRVTLALSVHRPSTRARFLTQYKSRHTIYNFDYAQQVKIFYYCIPLS